MLLLNTLLNHSLIAAEHHHGGHEHAHAHSVAWTEEDTAELGDLRARRMMSSHPDIESQIGGDFPKYLEDRKNRPLSDEEDMRRVALENKMKDCLKRYIPKVRDILKEYPDAKIDVDVIREDVQGDIPVLFVKGHFSEDHFKVILKVLKDRLGHGVSYHFTGLSNELKEGEIDISLLTLMHGFDGVPYPARPE